MKRRLLVLIVAWGAGPALAGPPRYGRLEGYHALGLQAGAVLASLRAADAASYRGGGQAGGFFNYTINRTFSLRPALLYTQQGSLPDAAGAAHRLHYLNVPLMLFINAHGLRKGGVVFEVGPQLGYLLANQDALPALNPPAGLSRFDVGLAAGVGYQRAVGPYHHSSRPSHGSGHGGDRSLRSVGVGLRYTAGLTMLGQAPTTGREVLRSSVFQLYLTYSFNLHVRT